jgi:HlyD family secretion protein
MDATTLALQLEQSEAALETSKAKLLEAQSGATSNEINKAQAEVAAAQASLEGAKKAVATSEAQLQRMKSLHDTGVASAQELDKAQAEYDQKLTSLRTAQAQLEAASAGLKLVQSGAKDETLKVLQTNVVQAEKTAELAQANLDKAKILAPVTGIASSVNVEQGEMVNPGASLLTILDLNNLWVEVFVPEKYLDRVNVGDQALISITSVPKKQFKGKVAFIASEAEFTPEKANTEEERADSVFKVRVKILEDLAKFKPGMSAEVAFPRINE